MNKSIGQIIAIGGGGFGRNPNDPIIEKYILDQCNISKPKVAFFPTATAEDKQYIINFYKAFSKLNCTPFNVSLFQKTHNLKSIIEKSDIIYIGGGNTKSMLGVFKEWELDKILIQAYKKGKILAGVSAGAICLFNQGITDSWAHGLRVMDCMNLLEDESMYLASYYITALGTEDGYTLWEKTMSNCSLNSGWTINADAAKIYGITNVFD